jgi:hypothetical protein
VAISYVKFCPRCQTTMSVESPVCAKCGHQFRTQFDPPVSEKTISMTVAVPASQTNSVSGSARNGRHQISTGRSEVLPRPRLRPRRLLILLVTITAAAVLYGGWQLSHGRDRVEPVSKPKQQTTFSSYEVVFKGASQGQPEPLALHDPQDLRRWQMTSRTATSNDPNSTDDPVHVHLYLSGQIALILSGTHARVLQEGDQWQRVEISDGPHQGLIGYVERADIQRVDVSSSPPSSTIQK